MLNLEISLLNYDHKNRNSICRKFNPTPTPNKSRDLFKGRGEGTNSINLYINNFDKLLRGAPDGLFGK